MYAYKMLFFWQIKHYNTKKKEEQAVIAHACRGLGSVSRTVG